MRPPGWWACAVLLWTPLARAQTVGPGLGASCPHPTANNQGLFCYDTPGETFQYDCANFNSAICNCNSQTGGIFYQYTSNHCCFTCGCCDETSPSPPSAPPNVPPPPLSPSPALPTDVNDWFVLVNGVFYLPGFSINQEGAHRAPGIFGYSAANQQKALRYCMTAGVDHMTATYPARAASEPYRLYAVQYYGPDGPNCNCNTRPEGCLGGTVQHPCQTQSEVNTWECNYVYPFNDGISVTPGASSVYGTGYPSCQLDVGFGNLDTDAPGCFYTYYNQGYAWYRPPLISDPWLDDIAAGTQINPLLLPAAPPVPPLPPPYPPGVAPTPPPAVPNRQADTLICFVGPINGIWSERTDEVDTGTTDLYTAKIMCLDNYYCTGITSDTPGITTWRLVSTCRDQPIGCQTPSAISKSYYRFDPDGSHGCWLDTPPASPPEPPAPPPPAPCSNLLTSAQCRDNYRYAGLCHTNEALRDCQLACGRCHDGCKDREFAWQTYQIDGTSTCAVEGVVECSASEYDGTADVLGSPAGANGYADGTDAKCTSNVGTACQSSCGCCPYVHQNASPPPPPPPPVCEDSGNVNCPTAIATLGCDCGGVIAQDCYKSCDCCGELSPPSPPPPLDLAIALQAGNPQDQHNIRWNVNYVFQAYGSLIEINDWVCWVSAFTKLEPLLTAQAHFRIALTICILTILRPSPLVRSNPSGPATTTRPPTRQSNTAALASEGPTASACELALRFQASISSTTSLTRPSTYTARTAPTRIRWNCASSRPTRSPDQLRSQAHKRRGTTASSCTLSTTPRQRLLRHWHHRLPRCPTLPCQTMASVGTTLCRWTATGLLTSSPPVTSTSSAATLRGARATSPPASTLVATAWWATTASAPADVRSFLLNPTPRTPISLHPYFPEPLFP